jgi:hypothetical protein
VEAFADGKPRAAVLTGGPEHLLAKVEAGLAKWTPEQIEKRKLDRLIEQAKAKGEGLIVAGEVLVEPRRH